MNFETMPSGDQVESGKENAVEKIAIGDVVQAKGELDPFKVVEVLIQKDSSEPAYRLERITDRGEIIASTEDVRKIEEAHAQGFDHLIAGNITAQEANDQIEGWKDRQEKKSA